MKTEICDKLGIEAPIFAFTHCRDVVAAVSKAGGLGVLGAVGFSPERLKEELDWIDANIGDKPYGVDVIIPQKYEGKGAQQTAKELEGNLRAMIPNEHREFADQLAKDHGLPEWPNEDKQAPLIGWTEETARPLVDEILKHPKVRLVANALGTPPEDVIAAIHDSDKLVAALCGTVKQAKSHRDAGVDIVIAQGTEGGGHTGHITSIVLWPQIVDAVAPTPVLAAGGIGNGRQMAAAMALGAEGVWTGTLWLTVEEASTAPAQKQVYLDATSADTVLSRSYTGKNCRLIRNDWTEAWGRDDTPDPLGMPLQGLVSGDAMRRAHAYPDAGDAQKVSFSPSGQVVGQINNVESCRNLIFRLLDEYVDAAERIGNLLPKE